MSLRDFFLWFQKGGTNPQPRNNIPGVTFDTLELENVLTTWVQRKGWKLKHIVDFFKCAGIETPIQLKEWDETASTFKCITAHKTILCIRLYFNCSAGTDFSVFQNAEKRNYYIGTKSATRIPGAILIGKTIMKNGNTLQSSFSECFCQWSLELPNHYKLIVNIEKRRFSTFGSQVSKNWQKVDEYLLGLDNFLDITKVYNRVMELMGYSDQDISDCKEISLSFTNNTGITLSKIHIKYSKVQ